MKRIGWRVVPIAVFVVLSIFLWRGLSLDPHALPSVKLGTHVPEFHVPELNQPDVLFDSKTLRDRVVLLNVWASWCAACVEEQVFLMHLAQQGVPIYGLNYKDHADDARQWLHEWGDPYTKVLQDSDGRVAIDLGVYGAPETFLIDKKGLIRYRHVGVLDEASWNKQIAPLMRQLEREA